MYTLRFVEVFRASPSCFVANHLQQCAIHLRLLSLHYRTMPRKDSRPKRELRGSMKYNGNGSEFVDPLNVHTQRIREKISEHKVG